MCLFFKGLDKGAKPPPPPPASVPRTLSDKETRQSVKLEIQGLNISQARSFALIWNDLVMHSQLYYVGET